jgi:DNA-nicking Smr family endonuclease
MQGVAPLSHDARVEPKKRETSELPSDDQLALAELEALVSGDGTFTLADAGEVISGRAPGVNNRIIERLRKGHYAFRRHIDLHGLNDFIIGARRNGERCVLVVTGRGSHSPGGVSVLRDALPRWLSRAPLRAHVLGFCTALRHDGGTGAFYVLLRRPGVPPFGTSA